jgi:pantoate--beta-alanine ligase
MNVARDLTTFDTERDRLEAPVGFVPTMGALHEGHLSLVRQARRSCRSVVASIFVNPAQFAPTEDLSRYPRDLARDLHLLETEGVDLVLAPERDDVLYPPGFSTWITVEGLTARLEGAARPTHFRGVATVVAKLFQIVRPQRAFFGQKDAQQALVIDRMIRDLAFNIELVIGATVREPDGLAMSSRNAYLTPEERARATVLFRSLGEAERLYREGVRDADTLRRVIRQMIDAEPGAEPEYVSVARRDTLEECAVVDGPILVSLAVRLGVTRLIDNLVLPPGTPLIEKEV